MSTTAPVSRWLRWNDTDSGKLRRVLIPTEIEATWRALAEDGKTSVLMLGEPGTGKEELAKLLWTNSERVKKDFHAVNCAALTPELLTSELFGYEKGAFTGANTDRKGRIRSVEGGTLLLDEIGDMSDAGQAGLLRFLQECEVQPVGADKNTKVDVRVFAATNKQNELRTDLRGRFDHEVILPSLKDRRGDIPLLIAEFMTASAAYTDIDLQWLVSLMGRTWAGNIRELEKYCTNVQKIAQRASGGGGNILDKSTAKLLGDDKNLDAFMTRVRVIAQGLLTLGGGNPGDLKSADPTLQQRINNTLGLLLSILPEEMMNRLGLNPGGLVGLCHPSTIPLRALSEQNRSTAPQYDLKLLRKLINEDCTTDTGPLGDCLAVVMEMAVESTHDNHVLNEYTEEAIDQHRTQAEPALKFHKIANNNHLMQGYASFNKPPSPSEIVGSIAADLDAKKAEVLRARFKGRTYKQIEKDPSIGIKHATAKDWMTKIKSDHPEHAAILDPLAKKR